MLPSPPSRLRSRGLRRGRRSRGRPRPNAFGEAVDFPEGGGWGEAVTLRGSARSDAGSRPGAAWRGGSSAPVSAVAGAWLQPTPGFLLAETARSLQ
ncbi:hypothetical protein NN561_000336 [Cricetulus griseus]